MLWKPKIEELLAGTHYKNEISVNKLDPSSSGLKNKERSLEGNTKKQSENHTSPPHVNHILLKDLLDMAQELVEQNYYEKHNSFEEVGDIVKKVRIQVSDCAKKIDPQVFSNWLASLDKCLSGMICPMRRE